VILPLALRRLAEHRPDSFNGSTTEHIHRLDLIQLVVDGGVQTARVAQRGIEHGEQ